MNMMWIGAGGVFIFVVALVGYWFWATKGIARSMTESANDQSYGAEMKKSVQARNALMKKPEARYFHRRRLGLPHFCGRYHFHLDPPVQRSPALRRNSRRHTDLWPLPMTTEIEKERERCACLCDDMATRWGLAV